VVGVSAFFSVLSAAVGKHALPALDRAVIGHLTPLQHADLDGTLWFYGWIRRALTQGLSPRCPDTTCFPAGECLGADFPNRLEAYAALPFLDAFPFPRSYNLFVLAVPVLGALAGHAFARSLGAGIGVAASAGAFVAFNAFSLHELAAGRPVTGLVLWLPLVLLAWERACRGPWRAGVAWSIGAGLAFSLAFQAYAIWGLWLGLVLVPHALARIGAPGAGAGRLRPVWAAAVAGLVAWLASRAYLDELALRTGHDAPGLRVGPLNPAILTDLVNQSLPWNYPLVGLRTAHLSFRGPQTVLMWAVILTLPWGWRRAWPWLAMAATAWLFTLGPYLTTTGPHPPEYVLVGGKRLALPMADLARALPGMAVYLRPFRGLPVLDLCLCAALAASVPAALERIHRPALRVLATLPLLAGTAWETTHDSQALPVTAWNEPSSVAFLRTAAPGAVIDLPLGLGSGTNFLQLLDERPRANPAVGDGSRRMPGCVTDPFVRALWNLGMPGVAPPGSDALTGAAARGFRYVVLWPAGYGRGFDGDAARSWLTSAVGAPVHEGRDALVWELAPSD
jgi:hypothetical protein